MHWESQSGLLPARPGTPYPEPKWPGSPRSQHSRQVPGGHTSCDMEHCELSPDAPSRSARHVNARPDSSATSPASMAAGLRLRIWVACLAGAAVASLSLIWVVATLGPFDGSVDPLLLAIFPWAAGGLGMLIGIAMAMWLDYHIVGHL